MKSIVEEASSIVKAIEKAWIRAGKPLSFQVKILEEPKHNFFGMTVKSAKIGFFFAQEAEAVRRPVKTEPRRDRSYSSPREVREVRERTEVKRPEPQRPERREQPPREQQESKPRSRWTPEMVSTSKDWLEQNLRTMGLSRITFSLDARGYYLRVIFSEPLATDRSREQQLYKSFAHLIMQMLRTKFKKGFTGFKVVLKSA